MDLKQFADQDLKAELQRREEARKAAEEQGRQERFRLLVEHRDVLLKFVPHSRTSCSDADPSGQDSERCWS